MGGHRCGDPCRRTVPHKRLLCLHPQSANGGGQLQVSAPARRRRLPRQQLVPITGLCPKDHGAANDAGHPQPKHDRTGAGVRGRRTGEMRPMRSADDARGRNTGRRNIHSRFARRPGQDVEAGYVEE